MQTKWSQQDAIIGEINIVPFVDVILVILIIFLMMSSTINKLGFNIILPKAETAKVQKNVKAVLSIDIDGIIYLNQKPIENNSLSQYLKNRVSKNKKIKVVIAADKNVAHGNVISLINLVRKTGVTEFAVSVESHK